MLRLSLRQLQIFVAIAQAGSTMGASERISLSQSATSAALNELERLLGLQLFERVGRRLALNENGRALLPRAQALLDGAAQIERMAREPAEQLQALRIGASMTIADVVLPQLLKEFLQDGPCQQPTWRSAVTVGNTEHVCAAVARFDIDIGLIEGPSRDPLLLATPWQTDDMVVVGAPLKRGERAARLSLPALREAVWVVREAGSGTREATDQALLPHLRGFRRSIELGTNEAIKQAVAAGLGFACLSRRVVQPMVATGLLREVGTTLPRIQRQWHWVVHRDKQPTPALNALLRLLSSSGLTA